MDVVGGKIVAAQTKGSEHRFGVKRSPDCVLEGPSSSFKTNQLPSSWRVKQETREWHRERHSLTSGRVKSEICAEDIHHDLRGVLSSCSQYANLGSAFTLRSPMTSRDGDAFSGSVTKFEPLAGYSAMGSTSARDGSTYFRTSMSSTSGSAPGSSVIKPTSTSICSAVSSEPGCLESSGGPDKDTLFGGGTSLSSSTVLDRDFDIENETPAKLATRSNRVPLFSEDLAFGNIARTQEMSAGGSTCIGLSWSPPDFSESSPSESSRMLTLGPFYSSGNSAFAQPGRSWIEPLKFLLKKELTVTDVGELGRIILPKYYNSRLVDVRMKLMGLIGNSSVLSDFYNHIRKAPEHLCQTSSDVCVERDAEGQLPHLDSKEGKLLTMEDYNSNKHWSLRYKWWPNNKSRMYVLESTGEFVKYHDLKDKDELILYQDGVGKLVIRAQKWSTSFLRSGSGCDPQGYKGKSTGRRSPKGSRCRFSNTGSPTRTSSLSAQTLSKYRAPEATSLTCENGSGDGLDCKLGLTHSLNKALGSDAGGSLHASSASGSSSDSQPKSCPETPQQSTHKLAPNGLDCGMLLSSGPSASILYAEHTEMVSYGQIVMQSDAGIDWEKLPDPPSIEFPGSFEFEDTWGDCM